MPLYDYKYLDTGEIIEVEHSMNQDALKEINGRKVVRVIRSNPVHFHGSGFYENDYKKKTVFGKK